MQGHWANDAPYYRCRFPAEYALANRVEHPLNVYLREDAVIGQVDEWLAREFAPHRLSETIRDLAAAQLRQSRDAASDDEETARKIAECDRKLAQYRAALDAGAKPGHRRRVDRRDRSREGRGTSSPRSQRRSTARA